MVKYGERSICSERQYSRGDMQGLKSLYTLINNAKKNTADGKDLTPAHGRFQLRFGHRAWATETLRLVMSLAGSKL